MDDDDDDFESIVDDGAYALFIQELALWNNPASPAHSRSSSRSGRSASRGRFGFDDGSDLDEFIPSDAEDDDTDESFEESSSGSDEDDDLFTDDRDENPYYVDDDNDEQDDAAAARQTQAKGQVKGSKAGAGKAKGKPPAKPAPASRKSSSSAAPSPSSHAQSSAVPSSRSRPSSTLPNSPSLRRPSASSSSSAAAATHSSRTISEELADEMQSLLEEDVEDVLAQISTAVPTTSLSHATGGGGGGGVGGGPQKPNAAAPLDAGALAGASSRARPANEHHYQFHRRHNLAPGKTAAAAAGASASASASANGPPEPPQRTSAVVLPPYLSVYKLPPLALDGNYDDDDDDEYDSNNNDGDDDADTAASSSSKGPGRKKRGNGDIILRPYITGTSSLKPTKITERQMDLYRTLLSHHHQLLVQTAIVSVRRAIDRSTPTEAPPDAPSDSSSSAAAPPQPLEVSAATREVCLRATEGAASMLNGLTTCRTDALRNAVKDLTGRGRNGNMTSIRGRQTWGSRKGIMPKTAIRGVNNITQGSGYDEDGDRGGGGGGGGGGDAFPAADEGEFEVLANRNSSDMAPPAPRMTRSAFNKLLDEGTCGGGAIPDHLDEDSAMSAASASNASAPSTTTSGGMFVSAFGRNGDGRLGAFEIQGIARTKLTLNLLDSAVDARTGTIRKGSVLDLNTDAMSIERLLASSGVFCNTQVLPTTDKACLFTDDCDDIEDPDAFTTAQDNLLMRGIEKYSERKWDMIANEYFPRRKMNALSRRYTKLIIMACNNRVAKGGKVVMVHPRPSTVWNPEVWSLEEDAELVYAVGQLETAQRGRNKDFWPTIVTTVLPHREKEVVRKRYVALAKKFDPVEAPMPAPASKMPATNDITSPSHTDSSSSSVPTAPAAVPMPTMKASAKAPRSSTVKKIAVAPAATLPPLPLSALAMQQVPLHPSSSDRIGATTPPPPHVANAMLAGALAAAAATSRNMVSAPSEAGDNTDGGIAPQSAVGLGVNPLYMFHHLHHMSMMMMLQSGIGPVVPGALPAVPTGGAVSADASGPTATSSSAAASTPSLSPKPAGSASSAAPQVGSENDAQHALQRQNQQLLQQQQKMKMMMQMQEEAVRKDKELLKLQKEQGKLKKQQQKSNEEPKKAKSRPQKAAKAQADASPNTSKSGGDVFAPDKSLISNVFDNANRSNSNSNNTDAFFASTQNGKTAASSNPAKPSGKGGATSSRTSRSSAATYQTESSELLGNPVGPTKSERKSKGSRSKNSTTFDPLLPSTPRSHQGATGFESPTGSLWMSGGDLSMFGDSSLFDINISDQSRAFYADLPSPNGGPRLPFSSMTSPNVDGNNSMQLDALSALRTLSSPRAGSLRHEGLVEGVVGGMTPLHLANSSSASTFATGSASKRKSLFSAVTGGGAAGSSGGEGKSDAKKRKL